MESMIKNRAYILMGPSGNGKSSLARGLEARTTGPFFFERIKPWTTRRQRNALDDDYVFVPTDTFESARQQGMFQHVMQSYGNCFGIPEPGPMKPDTFPLHILLPEHALRIFGHTEARNVFIDRYPMDYRTVLTARDPGISEVELTARLGKISAERLMADYIADLEFHNNGPLETGVEALYQILARDIAAGMLVSS